MSRKGDLITQYLLGSLSEPQSVALEAECFADNDTFERVAAAENDLIDDYLRGKLSPGDHEKFVRHFLASPRRRERVQAARILLQNMSSIVVADERVRTSSSGRRPFLSVFRKPDLRMGWVLAGAATLLLLLAGAWLLGETSRLRGQLLQVQAEQSGQLGRQRELEVQLEAERRQNSELSAELASAHDQLAALDTQRDERPPFPTNALSFFLSPGFARGSSGEPQTLTVPAGVQSIKLRITLTRSDYQNYRAIVQTPEGAEMWKQNIRPVKLRSGAAVLLQIPASRFTRNDYILKIIGTTATGEVEDASSYYFRVER